ncbi:CPBP family intramembrane metalloprotease [Corallincola luteus]|uniref:CPBP family intramembrane metalloprotease n=2 Tax=Corallincola TaxID=1775176 RepID=A0A368NRT4_9GAMM|nr:MULTISPECIES: CPBP family intramembrane glutamic endopeptidase [Corallincola]RCU52643.1 CPBP family intramembrane metalloprotease [Corallincola holothuriorum]TCI03141.1 CPBP family intramembrane metalloprotease [Corallincola luteus]
MANYPTLTHYSLIASLGLFTTALLLGAIDLYGLLASLTFLGLAHQLSRQSHGNNPLFVWSMLLISAALMLHLLPGFYNQPIWQQRLISSGAVPHSLTFNYDKLLIAIVLLPLLLTRDRQQTRSANSSKLGWQPIALITLSTVLVTASAGYLMGVLGWDLKLPVQWYWFVLINIGITVTAEEVMFRGLLQHYLSKQLGRFGLVLAVLTFAIAHIAGGWQWVILAGIAGLGYALAYHYYRNLVAPMFVHATVNLIHFFCLAYPMKISQ